MRNLLIFAAFVFIHTAASAFGAECFFKSENCVKIQGELMSISDAAQITDECKKFIGGNAGHFLLKLTQKELFQRTNGNNQHPLMQAYFAFLFLEDSKLRFDRGIDIEHRYPHIRTACIQAIQDLNRRRRD